MVRNAGFMLLLSIVAISFSTAEANKKIKFKSLLPRKGDFKPARGPGLAKIFQLIKAKLAKRHAATCKQVKNMATIHDFGFTGPRSALVFHTL